MRVRRIVTAALTLTLVAAGLGARAGAATATGRTEAGFGEAIRAFEGFRDAVDAYLDPRVGLLGGDASPEHSGALLRAMGEGVTRLAQDFENPKVQNAAKDAVAEMNLAATNIEAGDIGGAVDRINQATSAFNRIIERLLVLAGKQAVLGEGLAGDIPSSGSSTFERTNEELRVFFYEDSFFGGVDVRGEVENLTTGCTGEAGSMFEFRAARWDWLRSFGQAIWVHKSFFIPAPGSGSTCPARPLDLVGFGYGTLQIDEKGNIRGVFTASDTSGLTFDVTGSVDPKLFRRASDHASDALGAFRSPITNAFDPDPSHLCDGDQISDTPVADIGDVRLFFDPDGRVRIETSFFGTELDDLTSPFGTVFREELADGTGMAHRVRVDEAGEVTVETLDPDTLQPAEETPEDVIAEITRNAVKLTYGASAPPTRVDVDAAAEIAGTRICDDATMVTDPPRPATSSEDEAEQRRRLVDAAFAFDSFKVVERLVRGGGSDTARARALRQLANDIEREASLVDDPELTDVAERAASAWREAADAFEDGNPSRGRAQAVNGLGDLKEAINRVDELIDPSVVLPEFGD